ncbi:tetratricopeptide repeat protein, partial [Pseudothermotoga sp.]
MKRFVLALLIVASLCLAIINEEQARELFARALESWYAGDVVAARESMSQALSGLIYITDIPEFWFFTAKLDIDSGNVARALEDLRTLLVLAPTKDEAISLVKEIETFSNPLVPSTPTLSGEILKIEGFKNSVEYFYSPVSVTTLGRNVCIADKVNSRLIIHGPAGYTVHKLSFKPESVVCNAFKYLYVAGDDKIALFDLESNRVEMLASNLLKPVLAGFDRLGRLWGA